MRRRAPRRSPALLQEFDDVAVVHEPQRPAVGVDLDGGPRRGREGQVDDDAL